MQPAKLASPNRLIAPVVFGHRQRRRDYPPTLTSGYPTRHPHRHNWPRPLLRRPNMTQVPFAYQPLSSEPLTARPYNTRLLPLANKREHDQYLDL
jgi:hypothetical protein